MSAATASVSDVSRTDRTNGDGGRQQNNAGQSQAQCTPMPLPALGTQKVIQGNGTNVGTVISLQCPAKHKLVGRDLTCVMGFNSTHWEGETYCRPLAPYEDFGFQVAVLASIVSTGIILLMSMAFITCCLLDCVKDDKRKKQERESDVWQWDEQAQPQENNRSYYSHKGRNNNNNNTQMKMASLWDIHSTAMCAKMQTCRCHQEFAHRPTCTYSPSALTGVLPGHDYDRPLLPQNPDPNLTLYAGPPASPCPMMSPGLVQNSAAGARSVWQYETQQSSVPGVNQSTAQETNMRNLNPAKEFSIRIISV